MANAIWKMRRSRTSESKLRQTVLRQTEVVGLYANGVSSHSPGLDAGGLPEASYPGDCSLAFGWTIG